MVFFNSETVQQKTWMNDWLEVRVFDLIYDTTIELDIYLETVDSPGEGEVLAVCEEERGAAHLDLLARPQDGPGSDAHQVGPLRDDGDWNIKTLVWCQDLTDTTTVSD